MPSFSSFLPGLSLEHLQVLEYVGQLVDLVDGRPDAVVAAVVGRNPPLKDGRVFLPHLRRTMQLQFNCESIPFEVAIDP